MTSLSLLDSHGEVARRINVLTYEVCEEDFLKFAINREEMRQKWLASTQECQRLHVALEKAQQEAAALVRKLSYARRLLDDEKKMRRIVEGQRNSLERQIAIARNLLFNDGGRNLNDETREKLKFLNNTTLTGRLSNICLKDLHNDKLNTIASLDSMASILSDLSCYSKSEDDLDISAITQQNQKKREWKKHRPSGEYSINERCSATKKIAELNSSNRIIGTTTVVMPKEGNITASSVIEAVPRDENIDPLSRSSHKRHKNGDHSKSILGPVDTNNIQFDTTPSTPKMEIFTSESDSEGAFKPSPNIGGYTLNAKPARPHNFIAKKVLTSEVCTPCNKRIKFSKVVLKCEDCKATTHAECKDLVPVPCVPTRNSPTSRGEKGTIADYTPMIPPMVPSLVVHCINEVELRGMSQQGLYRVNGGSKVMKSLKEKFVRGKGAPNLSDIDITAICSTLKEFLRSLREPLITIGLRTDFVRATKITDKQHADAALYQAISELPQPNRDTLAFLILHLQRVSSSPECKMPISNLAKVYGPTLVGYSSHKASDSTLLSDTNDQITIVENLLKIPSDYWANFVNFEIVNTFANHT